MTLSEKIGTKVLGRLGYREPREHPEWERIVDVIQDEIDAELKAMARVAVRHSIPSVHEILDYEIRSSWWSSWCCSRFIQSISGWYFGKKTARKYRNWLASREMRERVMRRQYNQWRIK